MAILLPDAASGAPGRRLAEPDTDFTRKRVRASPPHAAARALDDAGDLALPAVPRMRERRDPVPVRKVRIGAGGEDEAGDLLMALPAVAEDHDLQDAGPAEVVDVVHVNAGREQQRHCLDMGALAGRDERVAAEPVSDGQI